jgi:hypothetical protein
MESERPTAPATAAALVLGVGRKGYLRGEWGAVRCSAVE